MIYIFGHRPNTNRDELASKERALGYLRHELPHDNRFRYRTTYAVSDVDSILFSFAGEILAELVVREKQKPNAHDTEEYPKAKATYLIHEVRIFRDKTLHAKDVGLKSSQFGTRVPQDVYERILEKVGIAEIITNP